MSFFLWWLFMTLDQVIKLFKDSRIFVRAYYIDNDDGETPAVDVCLNDYNYYVCNPLLDAKVNKFYFENSILYVEIDV